MTLDDQLYDYLAAGEHGLSSEAIAYEFGDIPWDDLAKALDRLIEDGRVVLEDDYYYIEGINHPPITTLHTRPVVDRLESRSELVEVIGESATAALLGIGGWMERYHHNYLMCAPIGEEATYRDSFKSINGAPETPADEQVEQFLMMVERFRNMMETAKDEMHWDSLKAEVYYTIERGDGYVISVLSQVHLRHLKHAELQGALDRLVAEGRIRRVNDFYFIPGRFPEIEKAHFDV